MPFTALFDACVLYPPSLRDVLLSLAVTGLFRARWTARIQQEWIDAAIRDRPELAGRLQRTRALMEAAVPDALVGGYEELIDALALPDPDDRHVLAAAIVGRADVIVTLNLKHFPRSALGPRNIEAQHPDVFIVHVLTLYPSVALPAIKLLRERLKTPGFSAEEYLDLLARRGLPETAAYLLDNIELI